MLPWTVSAYSDFGTLASRSAWFPSLGDGCCGAAEWGFVKQVVLARRDTRLLSWANWSREDLGSRPYAWLRPDFVSPFPFFSCQRSGRGFWWSLISLMLSFGRLRYPSFVGLGTLLLWVLFFLRRLKEGLGRYSFQVGQGGNTRGSCCWELCHFTSRLSWAWFVGSICELGCMLLRRRMFLPPLSALFRAAIVRAVWSNKMPPGQCPCDSWPFGRS